MLLVPGRDIVGEFFRRKGRYRRLETVGHLLGRLAGIRVSSHAEGRCRERTGRVGLRGIVGHALAIGGVDLLSGHIGRGCYNLEVDGVVVVAIFREFPQGPILHIITVKGTKETWFRESGTWSMARQSFPAPQKGAKLNARRCKYETRNRTQPGAVHPYGPGHRG
jgi:hypothetical protein